MSHRINRELAEELVSSFIPMFEWLEGSGVGYCLVGGLAVLVQSLAAGRGDFRATRDADILVPQSFSNADFAKAYLDVYATDPAHSEAVYEALFGDGGFADLSDEESSFMNISFVGASAELDGVDTPDFDVCRVLNARGLESVVRERVVVCGHPVWVATVEELSAMKSDTIALYRVGRHDSTRPQDFEDLETLRSLSGDCAPGPEPERPSIADRIRSLIGGGR